MKPPAHLVFEEKGEPFACPRCKEVSVRPLAAHWGLATFRQCPSCRSCFIVRRTWLHGLALTSVTLLVPAVLLGPVLIPLVREGIISPLVVLVALATITFPLLFLLRAPFARRLLRFEYVGRHAT